MIIALPIRPTTRPPQGSGPALVVGDIWSQVSTGRRERWDGTNWLTFAPVILHGTNAPTTRSGGAALQRDDIWVHTASGAQYRHDGTAWTLSEPPAGIVPIGGLAEATRHVAQTGVRPFDTGLVEAADGIAFVHEQRIAAQVWTVDHELRSTWVGVTVVDNTRAPPVTMIPDIEYLSNTCILHFVTAVRGFAVVHASK